MALTPLLARLTLWMMWINLGWSTRPASSQAAGVGHCATAARRPGPGDLRHASPGGIPGGRRAAGCRSGAQYGSSRPSARRCCTGSLLGRWAAQPRGLPVQGSSSRGMAPSASQQPCLPGNGLGQHGHSQSLDWLVSPRACGGKTGPSPGQLQHETLPGPPGWHRLPAAQRTRPRPTPDHHMATPRPRTRAQDRTCRAARTGVKDMASRCRQSATHPCSRFERQSSSSPVSSDFARHAASSSNCITARAVTPTSGRTSPPSP